MKQTTKAMMVAALSLTAAIANAAPLTPEAAYNRAVKTSGMRMPAANRMQLMYSQKTEAQQPAAYVFAYENNQPGFLIVSGDDQVTPVLGYSTTAAFDPQNIPDGLQFMLECYAAEINAAKGVKSLAPAREERREIAPLVKTQWNQDAPYFNDTPIVNGQHTVTGCAATSTAQVMNFHQWPEVGIGSNSVRCNRVTYTVNFSEHPFDWDNMLRAYYASATDEQKAAVANLMYCVGVGIDMDYHTDSDGGSGAYSSDIPFALINYFKYDKGCHLATRNFFSQSEWEDMMYAELAARRPIIYSGTTSQGAGHSFVCDGYQGEGYFHINWGWGGLSDGYFLLNALDPSVQGIGGSTSAFNYSQEAVIGIQKPQENSDFVYSVSLYGTLAYSPSSTKLGSSVTISATGEQEHTYGFVNTSAFMINSLTLGLELVSADGVKTFVSSSSSGNYGSRTIINTNYKITLPTSLASDDYAIYPVWKSGSGSWQRVELPYWTPDYILRVTGNNAQILKEEETFADLNVVLKESTPYYANCYARTVFDVTNISDEDFYDAVCLALTYRDGDDIIFQSSDVILDIKKGETKELSFDWNVAVNTGNYDLYLIYIGKENIMDYYEEEITVANQPSTDISVDDFIFLGNPNRASQSYLPFSFDVTCTEGFFSGYLTLYIFDSSSLWSVASFNSPLLFLNAGESQSVRMTASLLTADKDETYMAILYNGSDIISKSAPTFTFSDPTGVDAVDSDSEAEYFTLDGVKVEKPVKGMYIRKTNSSVEKVIIR